MIIPVFLFQHKIEKNTTLLSFGQLTFSSGATSLIASLEISHPKDF